VKRFSKKRKTAADLTRHFRKRWFQRISHDEPPIDKMLEHIHSGKGGRKQTNTRTEFDFLFNGQKITVVYNKAFKTVCTVLPMQQTGA
jgi:hypothetical protein